jgi:hypothetical protein
MLPQSLSEQVEAVIRGYRNERTGEPMAPGRRKKYFLDLRLFWEEMQALLTFPLFMGGTSFLDAAAAVL